MAQQRNLIRLGRVLGVLLLGAALTGCAHGVRAAGAQVPQRGAKSATAQATPWKSVAQKNNERTWPHFVSVNVPNLHYIEDDWRFDSLSRYRLPNEFEIHDALQTVALLGANVVRIYTLSVTKAGDPSDVVRHVIGPGKFNEEAFVALDRVLASAANLGISVIVPFVDNWAYWGGVAEYAAFEGKSREAFFVDEQVIAAFEGTLEHVLLRRNTVNGRWYRDDPAVFAWETGNELVSPDEWVERIAKFIKRLDSRHALIDGTFGPFVRPASLTNPNIDIVSSHHYGPVSRTLRAIESNVRLVQGRKRYMIGEFGLLNAKDTEQVLSHALAHPVEGVLLWSLRGHNRDGGYYHHMEKAPFQAIHFPGSLLDQAYEEPAIVQLLRQYASQATGHGLVPLPVPAAPSVLPVSSLGVVRWRGSVGARYYIVERKASADSGWTVLSDRVDEARYPYRPGYVDDTAPVGKRVRYRIIAVNETGHSAPSLPTEEVLITGQLWVDEMDPQRPGVHVTGELELTGEHPELCKMDRERLRGEAGARLVYRLPEHSKRLVAFAFAAAPGVPIELSWSANGRDFHAFSTQVRDFSESVDQPKVYRPVTLSVEGIPTEARELALTWQMPAELGRLEIEH